MAWKRNPLFIGSHFWFAPDGDAFTLPGAGNISQNGSWPNALDPNWDNWALGVCESSDIDPKNANAEEILAPTPGTLQAIDKISPYAVPEIKFTLLQVDSLAIQFAFNTQRIFNSNNVNAVPNAGGSPGMRGILKVQKYDQNNNLIYNFTSWAFVMLATALKAAPKTMTKPEFVATLLYSPNNLGNV